MRPGFCVIARVWKERKKGWLGEVGVANGSSNKNLADWKTEKSPSPRLKSTTYNSQAGEVQAPSELDGVASVFPTLPVPSGAGPVSQAPGG